MLNFNTTVINKISNKPLDPLERPICKLGKKRGVATSEALVVAIDIDTSKIQTYALSYANSTSNCFDRRLTASKYKAKKEINGTAHTLNY